MQPEEIKEGMKFIFIGFPEIEWEVTSCKFEIQLESFFIEAKDKGWSTIKLLDTHFDKLIWIKPPVPKLTKEQGDEVREKLINFISMDHMFDFRNAIDDLME